MRQLKSWPSLERDLNAPFARLLGIELIDADSGWAKIRMPIEKKHLHNRGAVQGGLIVALADAAFNAALNTLLELDQLGTTIELKVNFVRPAIGKELVSEGKIIHKGRRIVVGEMLVHDQSGKMIAVGIGTYTLIPA